MFFHSSPVFWLQATRVVHLITVLSLTLLFMMIISGVICCSLVASSHFCILFSSFDLTWMKHKGCVDLFGSWLGNVSVFWGFLVHCHLFTSLHPVLLCAASTQTQTNWYDAYDCVILDWRLNPVTYGLQHISAAVWVTCVFLVQIHSYWWAIIRSEICLHLKQFF